MKKENLSKISYKVLLKRDHFTFFVVSWLQHRIWSLRQIKKEFSSKLHFQLESYLSFFLLLILLYINFLCLLHPDKSNEKSKKYPLSRRHLVEKFTFFNFEHLNHVSVRQLKAGWPSLCYAFIRIYISRSIRK